MWRSSVLLVLCAACLAEPASPSPQVRTPLGRLRGSVLESVGGRQIFTFRGVRYAQPPVGERRFQAPLPVESWDGVVNATEDGANCTNPVDQERTSEDCLYLNVYTTKLPDGRKNPSRPVMVFLHPGAFFYMTGSSSLFGPQYLLDEDIVLVSLNYRLGALGFLSTGDHVVPGNNGFKDQVLALRWVQQNIASFGGDPNKVTLSGYSAGSISVYLHMLSSMSKGLFHRGIAMSAGIQNTFVKNPLQQAKKQARLLNCPDTTSDEIVRCLIGKDAQEIANSLWGFIEWGYDPMGGFGCVSEQEHGGERFLTIDPTEQFVSGNFTNVPLITGTTRDEFSWKGLEILSNATWAEDMSDNYEKVYPILFNYEKDTPQSHEISRELRRFYLHDQPITNNSRTAIGQMYSDASIIFPVDRLAKIVSKLSSSSVYFYQFIYEGRYSWFYSPGTTIPYGVVHHNDLIYLLYNSEMFPILNSTLPEYQTMKKMTKMWANFIKTGNPTSEKNALVNVDWKSLKPSRQVYLEIGAELTMKDGLYYQDRMLLWDKLRPLPAIKHN